MIPGFIKRLLLTVTLSTLVFVAGAGADDINLPDMGSPADAILNNLSLIHISEPTRLDLASRMPSSA